MDTAIPITHSMLPVLDFVEDAPEIESDRAIANLSMEPGWEQVEKIINSEIDRLKNFDYQGESMEQYGFKCLASTLCINKLQWIVNHVRRTEESIRDESGDARS